MPRRDAAAAVAAASELQHQRERSLDLVCQAHASGSPRVVHHAQDAVDAEPEVQRRPSVVASFGQDPMVRYYALDCPPGACTAASRSTRNAASSSRIRSCALKVWSLRESRRIHL